MSDEKTKPAESNQANILVGEHDVEVGGVLVMRKGERVSKDELADRVTRAAEAFFRKQLDK